MNGAERLRERLAVLDPRRLTLVVAASELRETLERLTVAEAAVERLESEAKQRLLFRARERNVMRKCGGVKGCMRGHYAKGLCKKHYAQVVRHGRLTPEREHDVPRECAAVGCERRAELKLFCRKHARQMRVRGRLTPELEHAVGVYDRCTVGRCREPHRAKGLCAKHYSASRLTRARKTVTA